MAKAKKKKSTTKKSTAKKKTTKKRSPAKKATKAKTKRKPNAAFMKPMTPSSALAAVIGASPKPRTEVTKKIWEYIKKNKLQDSHNKRNINADEKLKPIFGGFVATKTYFLLYVNNIPSLTYDDILLLIL